MTLLSPLPSSTGLGRDGPLRSPARWLGVSILLFATGALGQPPDRSRQVHFQWVPTPSAATPADGGVVVVRSESGRFHRFRGGNPATLPLGRYGVWAWGDRWVAVDPIDFEVKAAAQQPLTVHLRTVPGCSLRVEPPASMEYDTTEIWSTAGWWLPAEANESEWSVVPKGKGIVVYFRRGEPVSWTEFHCRGQEELRLAGPTALPAGHGRLWLTATLPAPAVRIPMEISAERPRPGTPRDVVRPDGVAYLGSRVVAWYAKLPSGPWRISIASQRTKTEERQFHLNPLSLEVWRTRLSPRTELLVPFELRFDSSHRQAAQLRLSRCSTARLTPAALADRIARGKCTVIEERKVPPGRQQLRFDNLDRGQYALELELGRDLLVGYPEVLPEWIPWIDGGDQPPDPVARVTLEELRVEGKIEVEGSPASGQLIVTHRAIAGRGDAARNESIPVDSSGRFQFRFLTRVWPRTLLIDYLAKWWQVPAPSLEKLRSLASNEILAAVLPIQSAFLHTDGRVFPELERVFFVGHSEWTVSFGSFGQVELRAFDSSTGKELSRFGVSLSAAELLIWEGNSGTLKVPIGAHILPHYGDSPRRIAVPALRAGYHLAASAPGYEGSLIPLPPLAPEEHRSVEIKLRPRRPEESSGVELLGPDGKPLVDVALLWAKPDDGIWRGFCADTSDWRGRLEPRCAVEKTARGFLIHPSIPIVVLERQDLESRALSWPETPDPLLLRFANASGEPLTLLDVELTFDGLPMDPFFGSILRTKLGSIPFLIADEEGSLELPPLRAEDPWGLRVRRPGEEWQTIELRSLSDHQIPIP